MRARPPALPLAAAGAGLVALVAQFALPVATPLPEVPPSRPRAVAVARVPVAPVAPDPVVAARTLFAPTRSLAGEGAAAAAAGAAGVAVAAPIDPFAGATLQGIARARGYAAASVRGLDGRARLMRVGERLGGWRLAAIAGNGALFTRGREARRLAVGETAPVQSVRALAGGQGEAP